MKKKLFYLTLCFTCLILTTINFLTNHVDRQLINKKVEKFTQVDFFENNKLYMYIHIIVILPILLLSFDKKVNFASKYKHLFKGLIIVGVVFVFWDSLKTFSNVWSFNKDYVLNLFIGNLPLEECIFFITVPIACIFINQCVSSFNIVNLSLNDDLLIKILVFVLLIVGIYFWNLLYTSTVCLITTSVLCFHYVYGDKKDRIKTYYAFLFSLIPFIAINGILTGGFTSSPIIFYNEGEFLNVRLVSIPLEDAIYLFPLLLGNISFYEQQKRRTTANKSIAASSA